MSEEIDAIREETKNKEVIRASYLLENSLKEMQNKMTAETMEQSIWGIRNNALKAGVELDNLLTDREIKYSNKERRCRHRESRMGNHEPAGSEQENE